MARRSCFTVVALLIWMLLLFSSPHGSTAAVSSCSQVYNSLIPCLSYLTSGGEPMPACCAGISSLLKAAGTTADRRLVCSCIKNVASSVAPPYISRAATLPVKCGIRNFPYKISPSIDCSKVN